MIRVVLEKLKRRLVGGNCCSRKLFYYFCEGEKHGGGHAERVGGQNSSQAGNGDGRECNKVVS